MRLPNFSTALVFGAALYISISLSAVDASLVTIASPRFSPPHRAFTDNSRRISVSSLRARVSSSTSDPADTAYAPLPRTTEESALSLVATYTVRVLTASSPAVLFCRASPEASSASSAPAPNASSRFAARSVSLATRPPFACLVLRSTASTLDTPASSSMDARSIQESASLVTENTTHVPASVREAASSPPLPPPRRFAVRSASKTHTILYPLCAPRVSSSFTSLRCAVSKSPAMNASFRPSPAFSPSSQPHTLYPSTMSVGGAPAPRKDFNVSRCRASACFAALRLASSSWYASSFVLRNPVFSTVPPLGPPLGPVVVFVVFAPPLSDLYRSTSFICVCTDMRPTLPVMRGAAGGLPGAAWRFGTPPSPPLPPRLAFAAKTTRGDARVEGGFGDVHVGICVCPPRQARLAERWRPEHVAVPPRADADASIAFERSPLAPAERLAEPKPLARRTLCPPREMPLLRSISRSVRQSLAASRRLDASIAARRFPDWR